MAKTKKISKLLVTAAFLLGGLGSILIARPATAVPSYAEQTGQPCAACHVGSFGPQLRPFGMDFKMYGYTASDGKSHFPPLAATAQLSYTHTKADQPGGAAPSFDPNDNPALEQISVYYAGRITPAIGAFIEVNYDGIARTIQWGNVDIRYAHDGSLFGTDLVYGVSINPAYPR